MENETEEVIVISKELYEHLCKLEIYVNDYCNPFHICPKCGSYVEKGWSCIECGYGF